MKNVLITGAGSLGEAFIRLLHQEVSLLVIDNNEWTVARLEKTYPHVHFMLEDFAEWKYDQNPVEAIIHTAAYKHLPLAEANPNAFIDNNLIKLRKLFAEASKFDVGLLFISSDKAVEPCSTYGYTKALGEALARYYNFSIARLGNILNSSGSVIPVWEDAISRHLPIPVTDRAMIRHYIDVDVAVKTIWPAFAKSDRKLITPPCERLSLDELLAKTLLKHGLNGSEVTIEEIGIRPGEKLAEKLRWDYESDTSD
jgi:FlaA1/EpsC-like NDP-sugar epimerase